MKNINLRAATEPIKRKINEGQIITPEELELLRRMAAANPNANSISNYAIGKRYVKENSERGSE